VKAKLLWYAHINGTMFHILIQDLLGKILTLHQEIPNIVKAIIHDAIKYMFGPNRLGQLITHPFVNVLVPDFMEVPFIIVQETACKLHKMKYD